MKRDRATIVKVMKQKHGGLQNATDGQCWTVWNALAPSAKESYMAEAEGKQEKPAKATTSTGK